MIRIIKSIVILAFLAVLTVIGGTGCNTAHGFGKDVTEAGQGIQNGTK